MTEFPRIITANDQISAIKASFKPSAMTTPIHAKNMSGLLFNSDGGSGALYAFEPPISPAQLCRVINALEGTAVSTFIQSVSISGFVTYATKMGELYGQGMTTFENENFRRLSQNVLGLLDSGLDPLEIWSTRAHELGMRFWASLRMNDIHKDWVERWPSLRTRWELERPHVTIGKEMPDSYRSRYPSHTFTWALDYAQEEVRALKLALIDEMCSNYDVDGIELDFLSHPFFFKQGQELSGAHLMTKFVRQIRTRMDEIGRQKGKSLTLAVRVLPRIDMCMNTGLDVSTWIEQGLVDVIAPATRGFLDVSADIREFTAEAKGSSCTIAGGIPDFLVSHYQNTSPPRASIEMMRAAAAALWQQGVGCLHLFNYDCNASGTQHHNTVDTLIDAANSPLFNQKEYDILMEIASPENLQGKDKHYYITRDMSDHTLEEGGEMQLPAMVTRNGGCRAFQWIIGDVVAEPMTLIITMDETSAADVEARLNGQPLKLHREGNTLRCSDAPGTPGINRLEIGLDANAKSDQIRIEGIEALIRFDS